MLNLDIRCQDSDHSMQKHYLEQFRTNSFKRFTGNQLEHHLLSLDAILHPESSHVAFIKKHEALIEELVQKGIKGEVDRYDLYNDSSEFFPRIKHPYSQIIQDVVWYKVGLENSMKATLTLKEIGDKWENCGSDFFLGYIPSVEALEKYIDGADWDSYIKNARDMEGNNASLLSYTKEAYAKAKSDDDLVNEIYHFNDGEYIELPDDVEALVWMIKLQQRWDLFVKVLDCLKFYPYQGCLIYYVRTVEECNAVINLLHGCQHEEVLQYLMREQVFRIIQEEEHCLKANAEGGIHERWSKEAVELYDKWVNTKESTLVEFAKEWISVFGAEKQSEWVSLKFRQALGKVGQFKTYEEDVLAVIDKYTKEQLAFDTINYNGKELPTLFNYALSANAVGLNEQVKMSIFRAIVARIYKTSYCPEWQLSEKGIELVRAIYGLVSADKAEGLKLLRVKHKPQEGYKVDHEKALEAAFGESFLLSVLLLQVETTGDKDRFHELMSLLYKYAQNGSMTQEDQFFIPFYIAELIASQVIKDEKDMFEKKLITSYPQLPFVLRILTANGGKLSAGVKDALKKRVDLEWQWEKKLMIQRKNQMWKVLEEYIGEL